MEITMMNYRFVLQTSDGGYFCAGNSRSNASGDKTEDNIGLDNYWVLKLDASGRYSFGIT
ncbi:MAG: hypothetical protein IPK08_23865 [Bacteroidetes bacterium]|nr:hypothetical protein [Bacteroidota bacterium]